MFISGSTEETYVTSYKKHSICVTGVPEVEQEGKKEETLFEEIIAKITDIKQHVELVLWIQAVLRQ